jgi:hypothetical protein
VSNVITEKTTGTKFLPAAFRDSSDFVIQLERGDMGMRKRMSRWKLVPALLRDNELKTQIRQQWSKWQTQRSWYPNINIWWDEYVKPRLQRYMRRWVAEQQRDFKMMENHLYTCIYDIQKQDIPPEMKIAALNRYRAKLVRLQALRTEQLLLDTSERDKMDGEEPTLYQLIKVKKSRESRKIRRT